MLYIFRVIFTVLPFTNENHIRVAMQSFDFGDELKINTPINLGGLSEISVEWYGSCFEPRPLQDYRF